MSTTQPRGPGNAIMQEPELLFPQDGHSVLRTCRARPSARGQPQVSAF